MDKKTHLQKVNGEGEGVFWLTIIIYSISPKPERKGQYKEHRSGVPRGWEDWEANNKDSSAHHIFHT